MTKSEIVLETKPPELKQNKEIGKEIESEESQVHLYGKDKHIICETEKKGQSQRRGYSPLEIVLDASEGFIPLWEEGTTLRWRFQERSLQNFTNPNQAKAYIRNLLAESIFRWGDAAPVRFAERDDVWDFEIVTHNFENCRGGGCVLASAFFPDSGRHKLEIYPTMFKQSYEEQVETLIHEVGHIFGLRHFFAKVSEQAWPSEVFGKHSRFSIMNYGADSMLAPDDLADLETLYSAAWDGVITHVNRTPIRFVRPYSANVYSEHFARAAKVLI